MNSHFHVESIRVAGLVATIVFAGVFGRDVRRSEERAADQDSGVLAMTGPVNDHYSGAINMFQGHRSKRFDLVPATQGTEGQAPTACWSSGGVENDVWYTLEADETGTWTVSLCGSEDDFDSRLVVYEFHTGQPPTIQVACADNECGNGKPGHGSTTFYAVSGQKFYIQVGAVGLSGAGTGDVQVTEP